MTEIISTLSILYAHVSCHNLLSTRLSNHIILVLALEVFVKRQQSFQLLQHESIFIKHSANIQDENETVNGVGYVLLVEPYAQKRFLNTVEDS